MKSKKPIRSAARPRPRRRSPAAVVDERGFTVVLEDLHAKFAVFGEALEGLRQEMYGMRDDLRSEMHAMRDDVRSETHAMRAELRSEMHGMRSELRSDIGFLRAAVLDLSKRFP